MKPALLTVCATLLFYNVFAYPSLFGAQSTQWVSFYYTWTGGTTTDTVFVEKDTVLNGVVYKKLSFARSRSGVGLMREDTTTGKAWYKSLIYYSNPADTTEVLAFDFSLQKGDTFDTRNFNYGAAMPDFLKEVDSVYYKNGLKHIRFKSLPPGNGLILSDPLEMIEGIGCNYDIIWKEFHAYAGHYLLCSYKDGVQTPYYNNIFSGNCNPPTKVDNVPGKDAGIDVYPLPANNKLYIRNTTAAHIEQLMLTDMFGKTILQHQGNIPSQLDVSDIPAGNYTLRLKMQQSHQITRRITVVH